MRTLSAVVFVFGFALITAAQSNGNSGRLTDTGFLAHVQRTKEFSCKEPQLRSIQLDDILLQPNPEVNFFPSSTVLARCDEHSGCCADGFSCSPAEETDVQLVVIVYHMIDTERLEHHEVIVAKNHTRCHCVANSL